VPADRRDQGILAVEPTNRKPAAPSNRSRFAFRASPRPRNIRPFRASMLGRLVGVGHFYETHLALGCAFVCRPAPRLDTAHASEDNTDPFCWINHAEARAA